MRIIAGKAARRRLKAPPGNETRPTADRVREAIFSILGPPPPGARVLDLFAGAGALGLEALSRGAAEAVFVDRSRAAIRCLRDNVEALELAGASEIHQTDALRALPRLAARGLSFHWIFLDPPYRSDLGARALEILGAGPLLADEAVAILEHGRGRPPDVRHGFLVKADTRRYGDTEVSFFRSQKR